MNQMKQEDKDYEETLRLLEEEADSWLLDNSVENEFEDTNDPIRPWRFEYQHESVTMKGSRFRKWNAE